MPPPERVILPMQQHLGAPCVPTVKKGDTVFVGTVVGDSDAYVSAPVHASVSGTVEELTTVMLTGGQMTQAVVIRSDGKMEKDPAIYPPRHHHQRGAGRRGPAAQKAGGETEAHLYRQGHPAVHQHHRPRGGRHEDRGHPGPDGEKGDGRVYRVHGAHPNQTEYKFNHSLIHFPQGGAARQATAGPLFPFPVVDFLLPLCYTVKNENRSSR